MEKAATVKPYRQSLSGMGPRGSSTAKPEIKTSAMQAMVDSPIGSLLQLLHADVPGKLESGLKAVGDSYKKAIDTSLSLGPTVMSGTAPPEATDQYNKANLELVADMAGLGAFSEVPKGALRMFGGRSAKTADQAALQQAQELTAKGTDRGQVWKETGWYKDVDGQWKFEIDDSASFLETPAGAPKGYQRLQHDELQGAYPDMWDATQQSISRGPIGGEYDPSFKTVVAKGSDNAERRSVANHEFQHATQETENFSRGGNPETARDSVTLDYHRRAGVHYRDKKEYDSHKEDRAAFMQADYYTKLDELSKAANPKPSMVTNTMDWYRWSTEIRDTIGIQPKKAGPARDEWVRGAAAFLRNKHLEEMNGSLTSSQINKFNSVMGDRKQAKAAALKAGRKMEKLQPAATKMRDIDKLRKAHDQRTDFELYQRLAGEAEARNVQTRMDYTPEQRRATPPWDTLDVPENELIVRMGGGGPSMSAGPRYLTDQEKADIAGAQAKTFGYKTRDEYFQEAAETGRNMDVPWRATGPTKSPEDVQAMEDALKLADVDASMYQQRNAITPEDIPVGSIMTPAGGDGSGIKKILNTIAGPTNTIKDGGSGFMQLHENPVWASLHGNLANLENVAKSNIGKDKYAITTPMGPDSMNFNNMMNSLMSEQMRTSNIAKKDIKAFNTAAKTVIPEKFAKTFPGIDAPDLEKWMRGIPGKWRGAILKKMDQSRWLKAGFPDIGANRAAVSRDSVRWLPQLKDPMMGYNVTKMKEGALRTDVSGVAHDTYGAVLPGEKYMGGMDVLYPRSTVFPTHQKKIVDAGITGSPEQGSWRGSRIEEEMTPQIQDNMMKIRDIILGNR